MGQVVNDHWWEVGELRNKLQSPTHALYIPTQRGEKHIAALFQTRNGVLTNTQRGSKILLGPFHSYSQILQCG